MAISSRYRKAFAAAATQAGPQLNVSPFSPGSVTTPAAIIKGVSMYAKAKRDQANAKAAAELAAQEKAAAARSQELTDAHLLASTAALTNPPARPRASVYGMSTDILDRIGVTPNADGSVDPAALAAGSSIYRTDAPKPKSATPAATVTMNAVARATQDFDRIDAPLLERHAKILLDIPLVEGQRVEGTSDTPNRKSYTPEMKRLAAAHLGINYEAWDKHAQHYFEDLEKTTEKEGIITSTSTQDRAKFRADAAAWRQAEMTRALESFRKQRISSYAAKYIGSGDVQPGEAPADNNTENDDFETEFFKAMQDSSQ